MGWRVQRLGRPGRRRLALAVLVLTALAPAGAQAAERGAAAGQATTTRTFTAIADASVAAYDDKNYGRQAVLRVDGLPEIHAYVKFKLKGLQGTVRRATLQLYVRRSMTALLDVHGVADSSWSERRVTWENAPAFDPAVSGSAMVFKSSRWVAIDVTPLIGGDGTISMALMTPDIHLLLFAGREAGDFDPRLVVETTPTPPNRPPVAQPDTASTAEDTPLVLAAAALTANDTDPDGDLLLVTGVAAGPDTHGTVSLAPGGVTYTPAANYNGPASFSYTVGDGRGGTATETVTITVTPVNDAPTAADDSGSTAEDTPLTLAAPALTANDGDVDGDALSITSVAGDAATHGTVTLGPGGVTYTPDANYNGPASFGYTVGDGNGGSATATVALTVDAVNDAPAAADDTAATDEDTPLTIAPSALTANDTDVEGDALVVTGVADGGGTHGTVSLGPDGVMYSPAANFNGTASFTYSVDDGHGGAATATVTVTVAAVNDAPAPADDARVTDRDIPLAFPANGLLANDSDVDGDALTVTGVAPSADTHGTVVLGGDGTITYTPAAGYVGDATFMYTVADGHGGSASALVRMSVVLVSATVETLPVPHSGDSADDPAIWVNHADPAASAVIGTDKNGGIAVYDLAGAQLQYLADGKMNNVDLRDGFPLGGQNVTLVVADDRSGTPAARKWRIQPYVLDPATRQLADVAARSIQTSFEPYGLCLYHSAASGKFYVFVTSRNATSDGGVVVQQWELTDNGAGRVDAAAVRTIVVGGESEGCVADDVTGALYVSEEDTALWRYGAEPDAGSDRTAVDTTGAGGHLTADIEGLAIAYGAGTGGYLIASSQGSNTYVAYRRDGGNAYVRTFAIRGAGTIDGTSDTDGIDMTTEPLGPAFPNGLFVAQDGANCVSIGRGPCPAANQEHQDFKLVPFEGLRLGGA